MIIYHNQSQSRTKTWTFPPTMGLHGTDGTGWIFERLSVQVWDLEKAHFDRHGSIFRTDSYKHPKRATFCFDSALKEKAFISSYVLPGCLAKMKHVAILLKFARIRVNTTAICYRTSFPRIQVNRRSRNKIRLCKNLSLPPSRPKRYFF